MGNSQSKKRGPDRLRPCYTTDGMPRIEDYPDGIPRRVVVDIINQNRRARERGMGHGGGEIDDGMYAEEGAYPEHRGRPQYEPGGRVAPPRGGMGGPMGGPMGGMRGYERGHPQYEPDQASPRRRRHGHSRR